MAKTFLWIFVIAHALFILLLYYTDQKEAINVYPMWVAIGIIAICESIEKNK